MSGEATYRIAIAHVTFSPQGKRQRKGDPSLYADATTRVAHYFEKALEDRGVSVVRAHHTEAVQAGAAGPSAFHSDASRLARAMLKSLDVDALLVVELTRWTQRDLRHRPPVPAAVGFRATLHGGPEGLLLWSSKFSDRQVTLFEDPWRALHYPDMGTRWLSAIELARWGSQRLVDEIPIPSVEHSLDAIR